MGELSAGAVSVLIEALITECARELPRRKRDALLRNMATNLRPEPSPLECRGKAQARREAAEWWLHKMPEFLRE